MKLIFEGSEPQTDTIKSFTFRPETPVTWMAGQSIKLQVNGPYGPVEHRFSIASPPYTGKITITTRLSGSDYKESLLSLTPGEEAEGTDISGDFIWRDDPIPPIFVAVGIGITPFHAMLMQRWYDNLPLNAQLIYGAIKDQAVYQKDLAGLENAGLLMTYVLDHRITALDIPETDGLIYISGPSVMVDELANALVMRGVPKEHIVSDWFTGNLTD